MSNERGGVWGFAGGLALGIGLIFAYECGRYSERVDAQLCYAYGASAATRADSLQIILDHEMCRTYILGEKE